MTGQLPLDMASEQDSGGSDEPTSDVEPAPEDLGADEPSDDPSGDPALPLPPTLDSVLVFSRTTVFRHDSIEAGIQAVRRMGQEAGFAVEATEDPGAFTDENLARHDVVVWLSTTGDVLNTAGQQAFERYIQAGGGWVGVHSASDTEYDWPWYGQLLGGAAYFRVHPAIQTAQLDVEIADHPSTEHLPQRFALQDEWYNFQRNPRSSVQVLMTIDESTYSVGEGAMGDHPIAWFHEFDGGRAWYTALGHRIELYTDPTFTQHVLGGIRWAAGVAP
jgi:type 1 glutamine amidotransferase